MPGGLRTHHARPTAGFAFFLNTTTWIELMTASTAATVNTAATEMHWVCVGYDRGQQRNDALGYWCDTAQQAQARCEQLHPLFEVYYVKRGELS
jgi:hypothetical protein